MPLLPPALKEGKGYKTLVLLAVRTVKPTKQAVCHWLRPMFACFASAQSVLRQTFTACRRRKEVAASRQCLRFARHRLLSVPLPAPLQITSKLQHKTLFKKLQFYALFIG
jgi:hypothetical protein